MLAVHCGAAAETVLAAFTAAVTETREMRAECRVLLFVTSSWGARSKKLRNEQTCPVKS